jgi:hypothetical protein
MLALPRKYTVAFWARCISILNPKIIQDHGIHHPKNTGYSSTIPEKREVMSEESFL